MERVLSRSENATPTVRRVSIVIFIRSTYEAFKDIIRIASYTYLRTKRVRTVNNSGGPRITIAFKNNRNRIEILSIDHLFAVATIVNEAKLVNDIILYRKEQ